MGLGGGGGKEGVRGGELKPILLKQNPTLNSTKLSKSTTLTLTYRENPPRNFRIPKLCYEGYCFCHLETLLLASLQSSRESVWLPQCVSTVKHNRNYTIPTILIYTTTDKNK